jgi:hypothetical protein
MVRRCLAVALSTLFLAAPVSAADAEATSADANAVFAKAVKEHPPSRGAVLPVLYGALAGLQAYDGWSTMTGVKRGAVETNPALGGAASNPGAMWAVKVGATSASVYAAETLWRRHRRVEAIATMVAVNGMMAAVAVHNASVVRDLR